MRILFINTTDLSGGAAVIIQRMMSGFQQYYHTENYLLVKTKKGNADNTAQILTNSPQIIIEKITDRISRKVGLLYQFFPFSSKKILDLAKSFQPDIINLHNTHGAYFATPLIEKLSQIAPIAWTLHDMWSFTANASHTFNNMSWKYLKNDRELTKIPPAIGINTGAYLLKQKKRIYQQSKLTIITPSKWLKDLAEQSPVFEGTNIFHIYNGVDPQVFRPKDKQAAKQKLNVDQNKKTIMFSSHFLKKNNPWKGGNDLIEILRKINASSDEKINFLVLGEGVIEELNSFSNFNIFYKGYLNTEDEVCDCLNAADLFIYPTRADNLPNTLVEAIACGTPCVTFDIGGNKEIIRHNYNGIIIEPFDLEAFAQNTLSLLKNNTKRSEFGNNCLLMVNEKFELSTMIKNYHSLFEKIITTRK
jgi:glycosyltransferase involved in cell wall biosynthesis